MCGQAPQLRLLDLVQVVLERPLMYTAYGSYNEVIAFIAGYHVGHHPPGTLWFEFLGWLCEHLGEGATQLMLRFRQEFQDDAAALQELRALYNAFLSHQAESRVSLVEE